MPLRAAISRGCKPWLRLAARFSHVTPATLYYSCTRWGAKGAGVFIGALGQPRQHHSPSVCIPRENCANLTRDGAAIRRGPLYAGCVCHKWIYKRRIFATFAATAITRNSILQDGSKRGVKYLDAGGTVTPAQARTPSISYPMSHPERCQPNPPNVTTASFQAARSPRSPSPRGCSAQHLGHCSFQSSSRAVSKLSAEPQIPDRGGCER
ncbi:hypothetical protein BS50DRAFT_295058 [Corynespora cassiicola Philippines]|uniref:Uncharacterized protein n=1 Tax=Corynespora cassiicola Philippines TaxID=1448308 RepID=A0A2T2NWD5_CORCC|nr:hypothetical protein BS50DRAFT_295058 [Corynespora cassiicola Philippines]